MSAAPGMIVHWLHRPEAFPYEMPTKCGARGILAVEYERSAVTCPDCLALMGSDPRPPGHTPPELDHRNGTFTFHDRHITNCTLEVVPMTTGNVELTISYGDDGNMFSLAHLDRMDLIRALLHDFHYSPEKDGPSDD